ncbi:MAG TPA: hypothetical protein VHX39_17295 [Acetobacteraceae bacterium]|nr:hypothetical protein [Acetobacteraceae bacterium]
MTGASALCGRCPAAKAKRCNRAAWGDTPCHGDVFHIIHKCEGLANPLSRIAKGARSRRENLEAKPDRADQPDANEAFVTKLAPARQAETRARELGRGIRTLVQWLSHDVLGLAGPDRATRRELFDFITDELERLEPEDARQPSCHALRAPVVVIARPAI